MRKKNRLLSLALACTVLFTSFSISPPVEAAGESTSLLTSQEKIIFNDVSKTHWSYSAIQWGIDNQIVNGYPDESFKPDKNVNQSEFLAMLIKAYKVALAESAQGENWDFPYLTYALQNNWNLVEATSKPINRGQVAKLIVNASGKNFNVTDSIHYLLDTELSSGKTERSIVGYKGNDLLTRAEAIVFVKNVTTKLDILSSAPKIEEKYNNPSSVIKDVEEITWEPDSDQKIYAKQVFKFIRFDIKSGNLKIKVPSMKGKDVSAGLSINGKPTSKVKLDTLQEFKGAKKIKLLITIDGEFNGGYATFDSYYIYSRDMVPTNISASKIPAGDDLIVIDQYSNVVTLSAVLKALDLE